MTLIQLILISLACSLAMMVLLWLLSLKLQDASVVDPYWGFGFVLLSWIAAFICADWNPRSFLVLAMVTLWGLRLSGYLFWRNIGHGEDRRYVAMREKHGDRFPMVSLKTVFLLQGTIMWFVALPVTATIYYSEAVPSIGMLDYVGIAVWAIGLFFESVGDFQMATFKSNPDNKGKVMDRGLWGLTRHPNYFGDFCVWWGHYIVALACGAWWTILSPSAMSFFLIKVSGVALLEKDIAERRPGYREYIQTTNAFFPGPPRKKITE